MIEGLYLFDYTFATLYIFVIYAFALMYRNKKIKLQPEYRFFIPALSAKLFGGLFFCLFSFYYYKGGDTFYYYIAAEGWVNHIIEDPILNIENLFAGKNRFISFEHNYIFNSNDIFAMVLNVIPFVLLGLKSYLITSILFALVSFIGLWQAYSTLCKLYPGAAKYLLIGFFFIPSALLWSSGILKDTISQGAIGWLIYAVSNIFIFNRKKYISILILLAGTLILFHLKPYILYILIPSFFIWIQSNLKAIIKSAIVRIIIMPLLLVTFLSIGVYLTTVVSESAGKYSLGRLNKTLEGFHSWHTYLAETQDQSGYSLGQIEFTPLGFLKATPAALNVAFYRPYLWEVRNMPTLLGAIEGVSMMLLTIYLLLKLRLKIFTHIFKNKEAFFMMTFALVFGAIVGLSSYNFGALSRYKIPAEMFFILSLTIVYYQTKKTKLQF